MTVLFPGTFDPFTVGHADIVSQALTFADSLIIGIGVNDSKQTMFTTHQRLQHIRYVYASDPRVTVVCYQGLTAQFAQTAGATCIVRGVRSTTDFDYERQMADINRSLTGIETILLTPRPQHQSISSTVVRQLITAGHDPAPYVPASQYLMSEPF